MSGVTADSRWWDRSLSEVGVQGMEKMLSPNATWEEVVNLGREDLKRGLQFTQVSPSPDQTVIDIGCGIGRMSQALGELYGRVIGVDISTALIEEARRKNTAEHISFELLDDGRLPLATLPPADIVFSYEVLYLLPPEILLNYFRDSFTALKPGGSLVFQLNLTPMTWKTHLAVYFRGFLALCGVKQWRGWPTSNLRRYPYEQKWVCRELAAAGFKVVKVNGDSLKQTWFVARKPEPDAKA